MGKSVRFLAIGSSSTCKRSEIAGYGVELVLFLFIISVAQGSIFCFKNLSRELYVFHLSYLFTDAFLLILGHLSKGKLL